MRTNKDNQDKEEKKTRNILISIAIGSAVLGILLVAFMGYSSEINTDNSNCSKGCIINSTNSSNAHNVTNYKINLYAAPKTPYFIEQNRTIPLKDAQMITKIIIFYHAEDLPNISQNVTRIYEHYHNTPLKDIISEYKKDGESSNTDYYNLFYYDVKSTILAQLLPTDQACEIAHKCFDSAMP